MSGIRLEVGKTYLNRLGERVRIVSNDHDPYHPFDDDEGRCYCADGFYEIEGDSPEDLIAEAPELDEAPEDETCPGMEDLIASGGIGEVEGESSLGAMLLAIREQVMSELITDGWTPPGDEWLRLDQLQFQQYKDCDWHDCEHDEARRSWCGYGPESVRVRRKGGGK